MFNNIASKIKGLAIILTWIGIILSVLTGVMIALALEGEFGVLIGVGIIIIGCLMSWIGSFLLYGFGQLIENTDAVAMQGAKQASQASPAAPQAAAPAPFVQPASAPVAQPAPAKSFCTNCGSEKWSVVCPVCGHGA